MSQGQTAAEYAPIAKALCTSPEEEKVKLHYKFDIAYFIAMEKLSFRIYPQLLSWKVGMSTGD